MFSPLAPGMIYGADVLAGGKACCQSRNIGRLETSARQRYFGIGIFGLLAALST
jgi:hypothetical protein